MAKFSESFFESLRGAGRRGSPTDPMLQRQAGPQYGSTDPLARSLGGMLNMDMSTGEELAQKEIRTLKDKPGSISHLKNVLLVQAKYAPPKEQAVLFSKIAELEQTQQAQETELRRQQAVREQAAARARAVGLESEALSIEAGGDLPKALESIRTEEQRNLLVNKGRQGRMALLRQAGATTEEIEGLLDSSEEAFMAFLKGNEGTIKAFKNSGGEIKSFKTNNYGRVWDETDKRWKNPSEMGVTPAPQLQEIYNRGNDLVKGMVDLGVKNFGELQSKANDAVNSLNNAQEALDLLNSPKGIYTGALGPAFKEIDKWAYAFSGGNWDIAKAANSEAYVSSRVKEVANRIKDFGAGTGLSDADREYAALAAAGKLNLTEESIRTIIGLEQKAARGVLNVHKAAIDALVKEDVPIGILELISVSQSSVPKQETETTTSLSEEAKLLRTQMGLY